MRPELILWDWNGTLLDDVELCENALNRLLQHYGYPQRYDHEQYRAIFGFPVEDYYVRAGFDFTRHSFAELAESYMEDYIPASAACPLMAGAVDALEAFKNAGLPVGKPGHNADPPGGRTRCDAVFCPSAGTGRYLCQK